VIYAYLLAITVFLLDFIYALVDPRVKVGSGGQKHEEAAAQPPQAIPRPSPA
jgi:hypothetical protein